MATQLMKNVVHFAANRHGIVTDLLQVCFSRDICIRSHYPVCFCAEQVTRSVPENHDHHGFVEGDSSLVRSLISSLIIDGYTGVESVDIASGRVLYIRYDPEVYPTDMLEYDVKVILRDVKRHGWVIEFGW